MVHNDYIEVQPVLNLSNNTKSSLHIETNKFTDSSWMEYGWRWDVILGI